METIHGMIQAYLDKEDKGILVKILEEIKTTEHLWTVLVRVTNNFYLGSEHEKPSAYLFTDKEYADNFAREVRWEGVQAKILEIKADQRIPFFSDLYRSGFEAIVIDKGEDSLALSLFGIIDEPEHNEATIMNPSLVRSGNQFYQAIAKKKAIKQMQDVMCREVYRAKLLVPVLVESPEAETRQLVEKSAELVYANLNSQSGEKYLPAFSDWKEFAKFDKTKKYNATLVGFADLKKLVKKVNGIALNPFGFNLILDQEKIQKVETLGTSEEAASEKKIISLKDRLEQ